MYYFVSVDVWQVIATLSPHQHAHNHAHRKIKCVPGTHSRPNQYLGTAVLCVLCTDAGLNQHSLFVSNLKHMCVLLESVQRPNAELNRVSMTNTSLMRMHLTKTNAFSEDKLLSLQHMAPDFITYLGIKIGHTNLFYLMHISHVCSNINIITPWNTSNPFWEFSMKTFIFNYNKMLLGRILTTCALEMAVYNAPAYI